ncbi:MAG TPA: hypothetical protein VEY07_09070 [Thermoplasmata archaeon]|nr:hypothetical protein [Thermoplasmata archaeon]
MMGKADPAQRSTAVTSTVLRSPLGMFLIAGVLLLAFSVGTMGASFYSSHGASAPHLVSVGPGGSATGTVAPEPTGSVASSALTLSSHLPSPSSVVFNAPGPHPSAWGLHGLPPGSEALATSARHSGSWGGGGGSAGSSSASNWENRFCAGVWPSVSPLSDENPQGYYASGCYGHDEPGIDFYSNLPGSGGNVTWKVTLPVDRSPTLNQSNLYSAIWFGMTLSDPYSWMDQCFLELQFYPDQTFYNPGPMFPNWTVNGAWIGAAVAWQIQASSGFENPCFYEPLYLNGVPGPAFLNMTQGDQISVTMTGWPGSTTGELLQINDVTNGQASTVDLYNSTGHIPLNPAYVANNYENSLEWTPGGEFPIAFSYETGHAGNFNWPSNNSFGGCSPGPTSTPADPGAPCPSYDPGSWANDTATPWKIQNPVFFNAHASSQAAQVGFDQDFGGISLISQLSGGTCNGETGAAWCSYPWYSYSCGAHAFEFGATDYTGVTSDFGKYNQYATSIHGNALGFGFYPPTNFSVPTCGAPSYAVTVGSSGTGGAAYFLSTPYSTATTVVPVGAGDYSLNAIPSAGSAFGHWAVTGGVSVATATSAWTTVTVTGNGTLTAVFTATPTMTKVKFSDVPFGKVGLDPTMEYNGPFTGTGNPIATLPNGASWSLAPGIYSVQALPRAGYNFSYWTVSNAGGVIAAAAFPYTWLTVTGAASSVTVTAWYTATHSKVTVELAVFGNGTVTAGALTVTNVGAGPAIGIVHGLAGTHPLVATPGVGTDRVLWLYGGSGVMTNFSLSTYITTEEGFTIIEAIFYDVESLTVSSSSASAGSVSFVAPATSSFSSATVNVSPGFYGVAADPAPGYAFTSWSTTGGVTALSPSDAVTVIDLVTAGTVTANFASATSTSTLTVGASGGAGGWATLDGVASYMTPTAVSSVSDGLHWVAETAEPGQVFSGWSLSGNVSAVGAPVGIAQEINVTGDASVLATFTAGVFPVTFVAWEPEGTGASSATLTIGGHTLTSGQTVWLSSGTYTATLSGVDDLLRGGSGTSNLTIGPGHPSTGISVTVQGSGTLYALYGDSDHDLGTGGALPVHVSGSAASGTPVWAAVSVTGSRP